jgi:NAD(P)-dependent dehydrogenase (short-subunit alcohol dehydrogenase family)
MKLDGKVAIVTGGSSGIGKEIAKRYASEGAKVVIAARRIEPAESAMGEIVAGGGIAMAVGCDVSKKADVTALVRKTVESFGTVNILVANAGILINKPVEALTEEDWDVTQNINLKGVFLTVQAVVPVMKENLQGKIILTGSIAGSLGYSTGVAYCASKGGVLNMMRALAGELAPAGINVNALSPGATATPLNEHDRENRDFVEVVARSTPTGRDYLPPQDMTGAALFLASEDSDAVHGMNLIVDDGFSAVKPVF